MKEFSEVISALASLAWPVLTAVLAFKFFGPLKELIESIRGRKFTVKVGDNELSVEEASEQQRLITSDIQSKLAEFERQLTSGQPVHLVEPEDVPSRPKRILWVDDNPLNNSYFIADLKDKGHDIETALSTTDGVSKFQTKDFDIVISDMGRPEGEKAGIDLVKKIRRLNTEVPFFIYCGGWAARNLREKALDAGVTEITSSGTTLLSFLPLERGS